MLNNKTTVSAVVGEPFNASLYRTGQKLSITVKTDASIQVLGPSDIKVVILQNNNWRTAYTLDRPTIYRGNYYEYTDEAITGFPAGKEYRWVDLRSLRLKAIVWRISIISLILHRCGCDPIRTGMASDMFITKT